VQCIKSVLVYQTKYRSQSTQFKLFISISARSNSQRKFKVIVDKQIRRSRFRFLFVYPNFSRRIYGGKNSAADSDIRRRLGGLFLTNRSQRVLRAGTSAFSKVVSGVPQGSVV